MTQLKGLVRFEPDFEDKSMRISENGRWVLHDEISKDVNALAEEYLASRVREVIARRLYLAAITLVDRYSREKHPENQTVSIEDCMREYDKILSGESGPHLDSEEQTDEQS